MIQAQQHASDSLYYRRNTVLDKFHMFTRYEQLPSRASELTKCFYCGSSLPATAKEHIFNSSWGGSYKTGNLICGECNSSFSKKTDVAFAVYARAVMNSWVFKGERHKEVPKISLGNGYFLDQGAKLKLKPPLVEDEILPDGRINSNLTFNSKSQAKRWIEGDGMAHWCQLKAGKSAQTRSER
jgi:hypothetical protein